MKEIWLKITNKRDALTAFRTLGFEKDMLRKNDKDQWEVVSNRPHGVRITYFPNLLLTRGTYDADGVELTPPVFGGPHVRILGLTRKLIQRIKAKLVDVTTDKDGKETRNEKVLPAGLQHVDIKNPTTVLWR